MPFKDPEKGKAYRREYMRKRRAAGKDNWVEDPDHLKYRKLKSRYGLEREEYDAMVKECVTCGTTEDLVVDHCHTTSIVRGMLCRKCNSCLGLINEDIETLQNMINYLLEHYGNTNQPIKGFSQFLVHSMETSQSS